MDKSDLEAIGHAMLFICGTVLGLSLTAMIVCVIVDVWRSR